MRDLREVRSLAIGIALLVAGAPAAARAEGWEWRANAGGEINPSSHGVVDLGLRKGPWSIQLLTDTLDLRYAPESPRGRWWIAVRGEGGAAGLMISPWSDGAPDPSRALLASYAGAEGGLVRYRGAFYVGAQAVARVYFFNALDATRVPVPGITPVGTLDGVVGRWTPRAHVWARVGLDAEPDRLAPHVHLEATYRPSEETRGGDGTPDAIAPWLALRAGWAANQDIILRTRVGGLNPYVVPVAGAGWAEWWVERYVAARAGVEWLTRWTRVALVTDVAFFDDGRAAAGFGLVGDLRVRRWFVELSGGYAPWIERQAGVAPLSLWVRVGADWGGFR